MGPDHLFDMYGNWELRVRRCVRIVRRTWRLCPVDGPSTALNIIWPLTFWEKNFQVEENMTS